MHDPPESPNTACSGCGLVTPGGTEGCRAILDEPLARDFSNVLYFRVHRLLMDTYSLQHPDRYCASAKSFAAHLTGLCWLVERGGNSAVGSEPLRRWLDGTPRLEKPAIPSFRGRRTIADARAARGPVEHAEAVRAWARSTWESYGELHPLARRWIDEALATRRAARR